MRRIAIVGGGISGLTAAWALTRATEAEPVETTLFEASGRVGGIVETVREDGFVIELGPDAWVTEKTAARELAGELDLTGEVIASNDATRKTYLLTGDHERPRLQAMPDGLRMMVPASRAALAEVDRSPLFSPAARAAFHREIARADELRRTTPLTDESIASFVERHFGQEVLERLAAPLLSGVFGGDVGTLSVRAVMSPFVAMEREHGSLIAALEERDAERAAAGRKQPPVFTTLRSGLGTLTDALTTQLPPGCIRLRQKVAAIHRADGATHQGWRLETPGTPVDHETVPFTDVILALPAHGIAHLLQPIDPTAASLLPAEASSAVLVAFGWRDASFALPPGFGLLVPPPLPGERAASQLLAVTFADQKFGDRVPQGGRLLRAFFGGATARDLLAANTPDEAIARLALNELARILGPLPPPAFAHVRRWPLSLPQYAVGHLERLAELDRRVAAISGLHLLGSGLRGVGLPDLIREARSLARELLA